jgi:uncharacterized protein (DUF2249 family)
VTVLIDGRVLQPPEPLERTLRALETLPDEEELILLVGCHPEPLLFILEDSGYGWRETVHADGTHELVIRKATDG